MRRYPPFYEGDDILRPDAALGESDIGFFISSDFASGVLENNMKNRAAGDTVIDVQAIVQRARDARNAYIASKIRATYETVMGWLESKAN